MSKYTNIKRLRNNGINPNAGYGLALGIFVCALIIHPPHTHCETNIMKCGSERSKKIL